MGPSAQMPSLVPFLKILQQSSNFQWFHKKKESHQCVDFPRDPAEGKNLFGPGGSAAAVVVVVVVAATVVVHAVSGVARHSRAAIILRVGGSQDGKVGDLDEESGRGLSDKAVPVYGRKEPD